MSTYDGAYSVKNFPNHQAELKRKQRFKVIDAKRIDVHHYHGSWFEYTWDLTLKDCLGKIVTKKLDTYKSYTTLDGKYIDYDGDVFEAI